MIVKLLLQLLMALIRRTESISGLQAIMEINASAQEIYAWMNTERYKRPLVQDAFPDLTKEEREFLITGLTPERWREVFGSFEEKDEDL